MKWFFSLMGVYWIFCLELLRKLSRDNVRIKSLMNNSQKVFLFILILSGFSWLSYTKILNVKQLTTFSVSLLIILTYGWIFFSTLALISFLWYLFEGGSLIFVIPVVWLKYRNIEERKNFFLKKMNSIALYPYRKKHCYITISFIIFVSLFIVGIFVFFTSSLLKPLLENFK